MEGGLSRFVTLSNRGGGGGRSLLRRRGSSPAMSPHTLRHLHAVTALDAGVPLNDLQAPLDHSSLSTTSVYLAAGLEHRRRSYAKLEL